MSLPWWAWALTGGVVGAAAVCAAAWVVMVKGFEKWW